MEESSRGGVSTLVAAMFIVGLVTVAVGLGSIPAPIGGDDPDTTEAQLDSAIDDAVGDQLRKHGVGGVAGETDIGTVRAYENPSGAVHFRVEADQPSYWRTSAYDVYSGTGWYRSNDDAPGDRTRPPGNEARTADTATVGVETPTTRVPAPWRPVGVSAPDAEFSFSEQDGIEADSPLATGDEIAVQYVSPDNDPEVLQSAGAFYPNEIEQRYTELPSDTPERVKERTAEITADAETPYETAVTVRNWLRENRGYTLDVPPPDGDVADELLFDRQAAHCAYFATTMAAMLRAEGVPARYAVGYTSGDRVGENEYLLRDAHRHAWVEVYFPDVGWVSFEPTPSAERSAAVADAVGVADDEFDGAASFDPSPPADSGDLGPGAPGDSNGEADEFPPENEQQDPRDENESTDGGSDETPSLEIEPLNEPIPGEELDVAVTTEDGRAVDGRVSFDGQPVGDIEFGTTAVGEVPYTSSLTVGVRLDDTPDSAPPDERETVAVTAALNASYNGPTKPNANGTVRATINGEPLAEGAVSVSGEEHSAATNSTDDADDTNPRRTDEDGTAPITLPADPGGTATITVERGDLQTSTDIAVEPVSVGVAEPSVILPGRAFTVEATSDGDPVAGIEVAFDGETATTDTDGQVQFTAPFAVSSTATVESGESPASVTVEPLVTLGSGVVLLLLPLGTLVLSVQALRSGRRPPVEAWLIRGALAAGAVADRGRTMLERALDVFGTVAEAARTQLTRLRARVAGPRPFPAIDRSDPAGLAVAAWGGLVATLPGDHSTRTPRAITDRAVQMGFPREPSERLLGAYRAVRYGGQEPDDRIRDRLDDAVDALKGRRPEVES